MYSGSIALSWTPSICSDVELKAQKSSIYINIQMHLVDFKYTSTIHGWCGLGMVMPPLMMGNNLLLNGYVEPCYGIGMMSLFPITWNMVLFELSLYYKSWGFWININKRRKLILLMVIYKVINYMAMGHNCTWSPHYVTLKTDYVPFESRNC